MQPEIEQVADMRRKTYWRRIASRPLRVEIETTIPKRERRGWLRPEDVPAYLNFFATVALGIFAFLAWRESIGATHEMHEQAVQAASQARSAQDQLKLARSGQRPWVFGADFRLAEGIINTSKILPGSHGWLITVSLDYKNSGNEPALNVSGNFSATARKRSDSLDTTQSQDCHAASDGEAIFPGETKTVFQNVFLPDPPADGPTEGKLGSSSDGYYTALLGCITYTSAFDGSFHTTKMAYEMVYTDRIPADKKLDPSKFKFKAAFGNGNFRAN